MKTPHPEDGKIIDKRRKAYDIGQLRHEKMVVMRVGERRAPDENQAEQLKRERKK